MAEICAASLDEAWVGAVEAACGAPEHEISPLVVGFDVHSDNLPPHYTGLRPALDEALVASGRATVETVANTLFPNSLWNPSRSRQRLFQRYLRILPALRRDSHNRRGIYFETTPELGERKARTSSITLLKPSIRETIGEALSKQPF